MIEVYRNLFVGSAAEYEAMVNLGSDKGIAVVHACKEPYHRQLLGYTGRSAPKDDPEYFFARRGLALYLNLIDAPKPEYIPDNVIDIALDFIQEQLEHGKRVFIHCNQGESRAPSIALLYLVRNGFINGNLESIIEKFTSVYPKYNPGEGMKQFVVSRIARAKKSSL